jgi:hypothetical protein
MIPKNTRPGSLVRVLWPKKVQTHDAAGVRLPVEIVHEEEREEETFTICAPFELAAAADGLDGIDAGTLCVYLADMKIAPCKSVEVRKGLHVAANYRWGIFATPAPRKKKKKGKR